MAEKSKATKPSKVVAPAKTVKLAKTPATNIAVVTRKATVAKAVKVESDKAVKLPVKPIGERAKLIAEHAYFLAAARSFAPGHDLTDWLEAEQTVDGLYCFT